MGKRLRVIWRIFGMILCAALTALNLSPEMRYIRSLPDTLHVSSSARLSALYARTNALIRLEGDKAVAASESGDERFGELAGDSLSYKLLGVIDLKTVSIKRVDEVYITPGGTTVGILIHTEGVLVVGLGAVETQLGAVGPAASAGVKAGDLITAVNGAAVLNADQLTSACAKACDASDGKLTLTLVRDGETKQVSVSAAAEKTSGAYRLGLWVRDSTAGVGTLSFCDADTGLYAALGHPVSDVDTLSLLPVREGRILSSVIAEVKKGEQGSPGELIGLFAYNAEPLGNVKRNTEFGIFGEIRYPYENALTGDIPLGFCEEAHMGYAQLLATVDESGVRAFDCEILRVNAQSEPAVKSMIVRVTDEELLERTGGIVQGMSGCPVIQDGKLIGVVTHVFVNDPTRGYCVYAAWMYEEMLNTTFD